MQVKIEFKETVNREVLERLIELQIISGRTVGHITADIIIEETDNPQQFIIKAADDESMFIAGQALSSLHKKIIR